MPFIIQHEKLVMHIIASCGVIMCPGQSPGPRQLHSRVSLAPRPAPRVPHLMFMILLVCDEPIATEPVRRDMDELELGDAMS